MMHDSWNSVRNWKRRIVLQKLDSIVNKIVGISYLLNIQSDFCAKPNSLLINPRRNNTGCHHMQDSHKKFLQHKRETCNNQDITENRTLSPTLSREISRSVLITGPRPPPLFCIINMNSQSVNKPKVANG